MKTKSFYLLLLNLRWTCTMFSWNLCLVMQPYSICWCIDFWDGKVFSVASMWCYLAVFLTELLWLMYLCVFCLLAYDTLQPGRWTPELLLYIWSPSLVCNMEIETLCCCKVLVPIYQAIQCHYPWDHNISHNCCEDLRCHLHLSASIWICQSVFICTSPSVYIYISVHLSPSVCILSFTHPPTHPSNFPSTHSPIHPLVYQFIDQVLPFELVPQGTI